jgi:hypothetical protein
LNLVIRVCLINEKGISEQIKAGLSSSC